MPELAEVETARLRMEKALKGKKLDVAFIDTKDRIVFDKASPASVKRALQGAKVIGSGRKGKYFWLELDRKPWPVFHLGMSGHVEILGAKGFERIWGRSETKPDGSATERPRFCKMLLTSADVQAAITDPRRFGRIRLAKNPLKEAPISKLGPDPLIDPPTAKELQILLTKRALPIKALLLDQKLFAGVGNWLADEILFQAGIAPQRPGKDLGAAEIKKLRSALLGVIRKAVAVDADYERFPKTWLFHDRWGKGKESYTSRGYQIRHDTIGGRTTAWVPELQR
ncbi:MAG: DNA-formamidopyrimidine glycosylase family protein [Bdellovibrionota bacterium]